MSPSQPPKPLIRREIEHRLQKKLGMTVYGANKMAQAIIDVSRQHLLEGGTLNWKGVGKIESTLFRGRRYAKPPFEKASGQAAGTRTSAWRVLRFSAAEGLRRQMRAALEGGKDVHLPPLQGLPPPRGGKKRAP